MEGEHNPWSLDNYRPATSGQESSHSDQLVQHVLYQFAMEKENMQQQQLQWQQDVQQEMQRMTNQFNEERNGLQLRIENLMEESRQERALFEETRTIFEEARTRQDNNIQQLTDTFNRQLNSLEEQLNQTRIQLTTTQATLRNAEEANQQLTIQVTTLQNSLEQTRIHQAANMETKQKQSKEELQLLSDKYQTVLSEKEAQDDDIAKLQTTIERLRIEIQTMRANNASSSFTFQPAEELETENASDSSEYGSVELTPIMFQEAVMQDNLKSPPASVYSQPRNVIHVNANRSANDASSGYSKHRHPLQSFNGAPNTSAINWFSHYQKVMQYHQWDDSTKLAEFGMAMVDAADIWWRGLPESNKASITTAIAAFQAHYGGDETESSQLIEQLEIARQGKESMITFGPKMRIILEKVLPGNNTMQMYHFYRAINPETLNNVLPSKPETLTDAISSAIQMERHRNHNKQSGIKGKSVLLPNVSTPWNNEVRGNVVDDPMEDIQTNSQKSYSQKKKFFPVKNDTSKNKPTTLSCSLCKKKGHGIADCYHLKDAQDSIKKKKKSFDNSSQSINVLQESNTNNKKINNDELDLTSNLFYQIHQTVQTATVNAHALPAANSFVVMSDVNGVDEILRKAEILVDTGAMISTISKKEVDRLQLPVITAAPIIITYGNQSQGESSTAATFSGYIQNIKVDNMILRIVEQQNYDIIFGMDWLLQANVLLDPTHKLLVYRLSSQHAVNNDVMLKDVPAEVVEILLTMPTLYNDSEQQAITTAPVEHRIETGDSTPIVTRGRRFSPKENAVIDEQVEELLAKGIIRPSKSPWAANPVVVPKPDGSYRFCTNFRALNRVTIKDKYPIPRMEDLLDKLQGSCWFQGIDLKSGYFHIPIYESHKCKTAFRSSKGLWEYNLLAQGLCNSPATFVRYLDEILKSTSNFCIRYLDDILCFAKTKEESLRQLRTVLAILNKWNLKINLKKCQFSKQEVKFIGFIVSGSGIKSNPDKIYPIKAWPTPTSVTEVMQFLGLCTFYHKFVRNLATTATPLYKLLRKDTPFNWSSECKQAFSILKKTLCNLPELAYPDSHLPYELHTDASNVALGAVLVQMGRPIAFASRTLNPAEKNYSTTERECLAVAWSLKYFHCYVHGAKLVIYTDHSALKALLSSKEPKGRIARWIMDIWNYEFDILHRKGSENLDADALSRITIPTVVQNINSQTVINPQNLTVAQNDDAYIKTILLTQPLPKNFLIKDDILWYSPKDRPLLVVPVTMRFHFIQENHDPPTCGHLGIDKTLARVKENCWWPGMSEDVKQFVRQCKKCQFFKGHTHKYENLKSIKVGGPCEKWAADIAYLPQTRKGNKYLLIFMDYLTKWMVTAALDSMDTDSVANVFLYAIILVYGCPKTFITDNGTNFVAETIKLICDRTGVKKIETSVEHPQTDGLVERMNRTIKSSLSIYCENNPENWDIYLPFITFAINTSKQKSTGSTPFEAMFGRKANLPNLSSLPEMSFKTYTAESWNSYLNTYLPILHTDIKQNIQKSQEQQQRYFNKNRKEKEQFQVGDLVLKVKMKENWKFGYPKNTGPWRIIKANQNRTAYTLEEEKKNSSKRNYKKKITTANSRDIYKLK